MYQRSADTWIWEESFPDYPANDSWVLAITLVNSLAAIAIPSGSITASGSAFAISVPASTTAGYAAGLYSAISRVSKAGQVFTVKSQPLTVLPSLATAQDTRSHARRMLDAINSVLENRASSSVLKYTIGSRSLEHMPVSELMAHRAVFLREVAIEDQANALAAGMPYDTRIRVRFAK